MYTCKNLYHAHTFTTKSFMSLDENCCSLSSGNLKIALYLPYLSRDGLRTIPYVTYRDCIKTDNEFRI